MNLAYLQDTKSTLKTCNGQFKKINQGNNSTYKSTEKNRIFRNKFNQGGSSLVTRKLQNIGKRNQRSK